MPRNRRDLMQFPMKKKEKVKQRKSVSPQKRADSKFLFKFFSTGEIVRGSEKEKARNENQKDIRKGLKPSTTAKPGQGTLNRMKRKRQGKRL